MTAQQRSQVEDIFLRALDLEPSVRKAFVITACSGDTDVSAEVLSLLAHDARLGTALLNTTLDSFVTPGIAAPNGNDEPLPGDVAAIRGHRMESEETVRPSSIGKYQVLDTLGSGAVGTVYLCRDPLLERLVAIKVLSREYVDQAEVERFVREARSASSLGHPNIITVYESGSFLKNGINRPYIVFEHIAGPSLAELIRKPQKYPSFKTLDVKLDIMHQLCRGLAHAHRAHIVHRDIKPANVMVSDLGGDTLIKILDFGIARNLKTTITLNTLHAGTPLYMSPEQASGTSEDDLDHRSDVFAVGAVCYELLTHRTAFSADNEFAVLHQIINEEPTPIERVCPGIDPELARIVTLAMTKRPENRYQDLEMMAADIRRFRQTPKAETKRRKTITWASMTLVTVAAALAVAMIMLYGATTPRPSTVKASVDPLASRPLSSRVVGTVPMRQSSFPFAAFRRDQMFLELYRRADRAVRNRSWDEAIAAADSVEDIAPNDVRMVQVWSAIVANASSAANLARATAISEHAQELATVDFAAAEHSLREAGAAFTDHRFSIAVTSFEEAKTLFAQAAAGAVRSNINTVKELPRATALPASAATPTAIDSQRESSRIALTLKNIEEAFRRKDVDTLHQLWASSEFSATLAEQDLKSASLQITQNSLTFDPTITTATAQCELHVVFEYKRSLRSVGFRRTKERVVKQTLTLAKHADTWVVVLAETDGK